jgi:hypothetical protein
VLGILLLSYNLDTVDHMYKTCPSESGTEVGAPLFPAVELCDFSRRLCVDSRQLHRYCLCTTLQFIIYTCI